jgi:glycyl-tRNA synthetase alpha subunit
MFVLYIEDLINKLKEYCVQRNMGSLLPVVIPVGAATYHPRLLLFPLSCINKYWIQRCIRPDDARLNSNNRSAIHTQFQMIVSSEADNVYLIIKEALMSVGITAFVLIPDNWSNPTIDSGGTGWEIHSRGVEIGQCTIFSRVLGRNLEKSICEIVFGLERIIHISEPRDSYYKMWRGDTFNQQAYELDKALLLKPMEAQAHLMLFNQVLRNKPSLKRIFLASHAMNMMSVGNYMHRVFKQSMISQIQSFIKKYNDLLFPNRR